MKQANSILITPDDEFSLGDGWGGTPDCVQIVTNGFPSVSIRFTDVEQIDGLIGVLSGLSLDLRMRACESAMFDFHASEGEAQR